MRAAHGPPMPLAPSLRSRQAPALWRGLAALLGVPCLAIGLATGLLAVRQEAVVFAGAGGARAVPPHVPLPGALPRPDGTPRAWVAEPPPDRPVRATLVLFHGNAAVAQDAFGRRGTFTDRGVRVVFAEYPGYGRRRDEAATFAAVSADARDLVRRAADTWTDAPLWLLGESLGAAVAARAAAGEPRVARVVLAVPWHRLDTLAQDLYPVLPVRPFVRDAFDSCEALAPMASRVRVVVAADDRVIPPAHARSLADCLGLAASQVRELPGTDHNDWFDALAATPGAWDDLLAGRP